MGQRISRVKATDVRTFVATMAGKGQVTIPKEVRERLGLRSGQMLRFEIEDEGRAVISPVGTKISDLVGLLGKPKRAATLEEMDEAIRQAAVNRYLRSVARRRRSDAR